MENVTVRKIVEIPIQIVNKVAKFVSFRGLNAEHFAILIGNYQECSVLIRVHSECITGDVFGSKRCDCGPQLKGALKQMDDHGGGVLIYLRQEGRGIGFYSKLDAYELQIKGVDTFTANEMLGYKDDLREFECAVAMLNALDIERVRLITNNPEKVSALRRGGVKIDEVVPSGVYLTSENEFYLRSKVATKKHTIELD